MSQPFPFFAGQQDSLSLGQVTVLSPMPVKTGIRDAGYCTALLRQNSTFIDIGGAAGLIMQGHMLYTVLLIVAVACGLVFYLSGGWYGIDSAINAVVALDNGVEVYGIDWDELTGLLMLYGVPLGFGSTVTCYVFFLIWQQARKTVPMRFHRQRREVAMGKWNPKTRQVEMRYVPWESVCAMARQSGSVTPYGTLASGSLFIGVNDENNSGHFWNTLTLGTADQLDAAMQWEWIRRFMEEARLDERHGQQRRSKTCRHNESTIDVKTTLTFSDLIDEYCRENHLDRAQFSFGRRLWWELNGTRIGVFLHNLYMSIARRNNRHDPEFAAWSQPLAKKQWAKPSEALNYYNQKLSQNDYQRGRTLFNTGDIRRKYTKYGKAEKNPYLEIS
uniref:hypothetical protein n=1 Tax=Thaumasiovibrio occultus TaxID=1891184 RepID=UPI000B35444B|nr:hypothetical protein [Thaumasiovibrio occultus]